MSVIFPGNYVARLNAYRDQAVTALPGVNFHQIIGVAKVTESTSGSSTLSLVIPSPDLRQDDKPRLDKPVVLAASSEAPATIYRTAISSYNLSTAGGGSLTVSGPTAGALGAVLTADGGGVLPEAGATTIFNFSTESVESSDVTIEVSASAALSIVDAKECGYVLVEICYYTDGAAPDKDEVSLPYETEAGQGY